MSKNTKTTDLFAKPQESNKARHVYSIFELTQDIKLILENTFSEVWVEGEVSNFKAYPSGHFYFTLKDEKAALQAVIFGGADNKDIKFKFEDGLKVICFGRVDVFAPRGQYQLIIEKIEPKGIGSLQLALEQLKEKLEKEGLFALEHKKAIPYLPSRIGIVTSISGAAIRDILKVLDTRFKDVHIIINPVRVQGEGAKEDIVQAIKDFNFYNQQLPNERQVEVMIVGRGGGSIEDLWAFNEEIVARAIYNSKIPIISAVGHERDWTIADLVADLRTPTPSVAAEKVIPKKEDLKRELNDLSGDLKRIFLDIALNFQQIIDDLVHRLCLSMEHVFTLNANRLNNTIKKLTLLNPSVVIEQYKAKTADLEKQIYVYMGHFFQLRYAEFIKATEKLSGLSPLNILSRGYSITFKMPEGEIIKDVRFIKPGDRTKTKLHKGEILSQVTEVFKNG